MEKRRIFAVMDSFKGTDVPEGAPWVAGGEAPEVVEPIFSTDETTPVKDPADAEHEARVNVWMDSIKLFIRNIDVGSL